MGVPETGWKRTVFASTARLAIEPEFPVTLFYPFLR